jgi:hypothetical protein
MPIGVYEHKKGIYKHSQKTKDKISNKHIGKKLSLETKLKISKNNARTRYWLGKKRPNLVSEEYKKILRKKMIGNKFSKGNVMSLDSRKKISDSTKGEKCHFWKGGVTPINNTIRRSLEYRLWRESVYIRDNFTCVWCGAKSCIGNKVILNADHIKPFSIKRICGKKIKQVFVDIINDNLSVADL